ncbi:MULTISPECIES: outer membrane beta-barrel protein [Anaeromyxobacter]|uniref:outer membrane beta-barrel protein n=1 Tax=Anaeromyxobacter TaxID=161492 RepID=UPI001F5A9C6E|nr:MULTISPECIES: outer membrane beta-barrel protein [unclassified Anaeromyxobacter]
MKKLVFALAALALSATAHAQDARRPFGLGISIVPLEGAGPPTIEVYAPINVAPTLRIEPSLGVLTQDRPAGQVDRSDVTVGVGVFYVQRLAAPFDLYMGGRFKLNFASRDNGTNDESGTDVILAAAIGGEHYLTTNFSLGAEAQLGFRSDSDASGDSSGVFTTGLAFLRFYF